MDWHWLSPAGERELARVTEQSQHKVVLEAIKATQPEELRVIVAWCEQHGGPSQAAVFSNNVSWHLWRFKQRGYVHVQRKGTQREMERRCGPIARACATLREAVGLVAWRPVTALEAAEYLTALGRTDADEAEVRRHLASAGYAAFSGGRSMRLCAFKRGGEHGRDFIDWWIRSAR